MKPLKVFMQAFGPYSKRECCNFEDLAGHEIFLITGQTGGGKTSILDAMCFSLYGKATGELRSFRSMRNISSDEETDTETEFIFKLGEDKYKFIRRLSFHKKRNETVEERINAEGYKFQDQDWILISSGADNTTKKAEEILGFNHSQFSQVVVLPQGEFRKLLTSSSKEKLAILQTLFNTGRWQRLIEILSKKVYNLKIGLSEVMIKKEVLLKSVSAKSKEMLLELISSSQKELEDVSLKSIEIEKHLNKCEQKLAEAKNISALFNEKLRCEKEISELKKSKDEMSQLKAEYDEAMIAKSIYPVYRQYLIAANEIKTRTDEYNKAIVDLEKLKKLKIKTEKTRKSAEKALLNESELLRIIAERESLNQDFLEIEKANAEIEKLSRSEKQLKEENESCCDESIKLDLRIKEGEEIVASINNEYILPFQQNVLKRATLKEACDNLKRLELSKSELLNLNKEKLSEQTKVNIVLLDLKEKENTLKKLENAAQLDSAYSLSLSLEDGKSCPVCGAFHHPKPAVPVGKIDESLIEKAKSRLEESKTEQEEAESKYNLVFIKSETVLKETQRLIEICKKYPENIFTEFDEINKWIEVAEQNRLKYKKYTEILNEFKKDTEQLKIRFKKNSDELNSVSNRILIFQDRVKKLNEKNPENQAADNFAAQTELLKVQIRTIKKNANDAQNADNETGISITRQSEFAIQSEKALLQAKERLSVAETEYKTAFSALEIKENIESLIKSEEWLEMAFDKTEKYKSETARLTQRLKELDIKLDKQQMPDLKKAVEELDEMRKKNADIHSELGKDRQRVSQLFEVKNSCDEISQNGSELEKKYNMVFRIFSLLSGKNPHRTPINNFILGLTLDDVVSAASRYLYKFTKGRYSLCRVDVIGGSAIRGLDIEVMDSYRGGLRSVGTLSGGELFLASLSLALGLAEIVESYAGGIRLDSIFIDEGFGSLDSETLELAMNALEMLCKDGRMVGIISHVSELKERIPARIEVNTGENGVCLKVIAD